MSFNQIDFGNRLHDRRIELGMTQDQLGKAVGVSVQHIGRMERGERTPSLELLVSLSDALYTTCDYLLTGEMDDQTEAMTILYKALKEIQGLR